MPTRGLGRRLGFHLGGGGECPWAGGGLGLGFGGEDLVCGEGQPCPSLYRWEARPRGGESLPNSAWRWAAGWRRELLPNSVSTSPSFPLSKTCRLTFKLAVC